MFEGGSGQRQIALPFWGKEGAVPFYWLPLFLQLEQPPGNDEEGFTGLRGDKLVGEAEAVTVVPPEPGRFDAAEPGFAGNNHPSATGRADYVEQRFRLAAYSTLESAEIFGIRQAEQDIRYPQRHAVQQDGRNPLCLALHFVRGFFEIPICSWGRILLLCLPTAEGAI